MWDISYALHRFEINIKTRLLKIVINGKRMVHYMGYSEPPIFRTGFAIRYNIQHHFVFIKLNTKIVFLVI